MEITTFRRDGDYRDHRRPEQVTFTTSLEEDLSRRDFTVNAMAMDLRGTFQDPFGGTVDLRRGSAVRRRAGTAVPGGCPAYDAGAAVCGGPGIFH